MKHDLETLLRWRGTKALTEALQVTPENLDTLLDAAQQAVDLEAACWRLLDALNRCDDLVEDPNIIEASQAIDALIGYEFDA